MVHWWRFDRQVGGTNLFMIDRMYINDFIRERGGMIAILVGTFMLDHSLVMLATYDGKQLTALMMCIPESILVDEQLGGLIHHLWMGLTW